MSINEELKQYIEKNIFPSYAKNDLGHNLEHIEYVIKRSLKFAQMVPNINYQMVYVIAAYHDIGHYIDAKNHEKVSSEMLLQDQSLLNWFSEEEIQIMGDAVCDHRASLDKEPRSNYGKIVSSADRNTTIDLVLKRTYEYRIKHNLNASLDEIIEESRLHLINKFGKDGYAREKMYFPDEEYDEFLDDMIALTSDPILFRKLFLKVNCLEETVIKKEFRIKKFRSEIK